MRLYKMISDIILPLICIMLYLSGPALACIYKFGTSPDSLAAPHGGSHWDHAMNGDNWNGVDATGQPWKCMSGVRQSPINIPRVLALGNSGSSSLPSKFRTTWSYPPLVSNGSNIEVINNGHTIQIEWLSPFAAKVKISVPVHQSDNTSVTAVLGMAEKDHSTTVQATPLQFHFHATSEHLIGGTYYPLEMHIVHRVTDLPACVTVGGCYSVTSVLFELTDADDNQLLEAIWEAMPMREGALSYLPAGAMIHLDKLLPSSKQRSYVTYEGSLTTPPCSEGLLWHVMTHPQQISRAQWIKYRTAVGMKDCVAKNQTGSSTHHHHRHQHRRLLSEEPTGNPSDYICTVMAYGSNFRIPQQLYGRSVKVAQAEG